LRKAGRKSQKNLAKTCGVDEKQGGVALFSEKMANSPAKSLFFEIA
jgi:hypothetical protein